MNFFGWTWSKIVDKTGNIITGKDETNDIFSLDVNIRSGTVSIIPAAPPQGSIPISDVVYDEINKQDDRFTVIPTGEQVFVQLLAAAGGWDNTGGSEIVLFYAPNGDTTGLILIDALITNGSSPITPVTFKVPDLGDGTRAILLRRDRLGGGSSKVKAKWSGYF